MIVLAPYDYGNKVVLKICQLILAPLCSQIDWKPVFFSSLISIECTLSRLVLRIFRLINFIIITAFS